MTMLSRIDRKKTPLFFTSALLTVAMAIVPSGISGQERKASQKSTSLPKVVVLPTLGNDHQFNLDYTVAHLMALLDSISPDAILLNDHTEWLRRDCPWIATPPETHAALAYARERSLPILGMGITPIATYEETAKTLKGYNERYPDVRSVRGDARARLDTTTATFARDYSFTGESRDPHALVTRIFRAKIAEWTPSRRDSTLKRSKQIAEAFERLAVNNPTDRQWAIVLSWGDALFVEEVLRERGTVKIVPINNYLPLKPKAIDKRMDYTNTAWILAGVLDEWFGMWAPQVFPSERIAALLARLKRLRPGHPVTEFLEARWLMQNRDYKSAEPILERLINTAGDAKFPFPLNGKWIRPPWRSVRDKAKLNLAFLYDYKGERDKALKLYRELLELGDRLNDEARAGGYAYDDIRSVIESYTKESYTGMPEEAFRHFPLTAKVPTCAPGLSQK